MAHDRPTHPKMHITRGVRGMEGEETAIPDVQAAAEPDGPIDDQHLAVIAQVRVRLRERDSQRKEVRHRYAALPQRAENRWMAVARAHSVDQDPHRNATRRCARERVHELASRRRRGRRCMWRTPHCGWRRRSRPASPGRLRRRSPGCRRHSRPPVAGASPSPRAAPARATRREPDPGSVRRRRLRSACGRSVRDPRR